MIIQINEKEYELYFGIGFVRAMDEKYNVQSVAGIKVGIAMETRIPQLLAGDVLTLSEFLYEATCTEKKRPTQADIDRYIDGVADIDALFTEVIAELKKQNATKTKMVELEAELERQKELLKNQGKN